MRCGQIFVTEEPGRSFLCIKEWARGRAEEIHPKTGSKMSMQQLHRSFWAVGRGNLRWELDTGRGIS